MSQTSLSGDIKLSNSDLNFQNVNINQEIPKEENNYKPNLININNANFINEEDIQFECSHLSRSGSVEYIKEKDNNNNNCNYVLKNERNNLYKNYLREKRSKSLEKSLSKSLSRTSEAISRTEKRNIIETNIRNIRPIHDNYNDNYNSISMNSGSGKFLNEDLPVKMPIRLDKNLVKRNAPKRKNTNNIIHHHHYNNNKVMHNFYLDNNYEDLNLNNQTNYNIEKEQYYQGNQPYNYQNNYSDNYYEQDMTTFENKENSYNNGIGFKGGKFDDSRININDLDLKIYQEDMGSSSINNGRY
jgi:hypothetical protein